MKYFFQLLSGAIFPFLLWLSTGPGGGVSTASANITFKWINTAGFSLVALVCLFMYAFFVNKERASRSGSCYTKAQWSALLGFFACTSYAVTTYRWIQVISGPTADLAGTTGVDMGYAITDMMIIGYVLLTNELKLNIFFQRTLLPFLKDPPHRKKILEIMIEDGVITAEQKNKALKKQREVDSTEGEI